MTFDVPDPGFDHTLGATLGRVAPGVVEIEVLFSAGVSQQHGFFHGGVMGAIADSACGYAAMTLTPAGAEVLTVEYKVNFLSPGRGERLVARGRVTRPGRTLTVCAGDVVAVSGGDERLVATMLATSPMRTATPERARVAAVRPASPRWWPCRRLRAVRHRLRDVRAP